MEHETKDLLDFVAGHCDPARKQQIAERLGDEDSPASRFFRVLRQRLTNPEMVDWGALIMVPQIDPGRSPVAAKKPRRHKHPAPSAGGSPRRRRSPRASREAEEPRPDDACVELGDEYPEETYERMEIFHDPGDDD